MTLLVEAMKGKLFEPLAVIYVDVFSLVFTEV